MLEVSAISIVVQILSLFDNYAPNTESNRFINLSIFVLSTFPRQSLEKIAYLKIYEPKI